MYYVEHRFQDEGWRRASSHYTLIDALVTAEHDSRNSICCGMARVISEAGFVFVTFGAGHAPAEVVSAGAAGVFIRMDAADANGMSYYVPIRNGMEINVDVTAQPVTPVEERQARLIRIRERDQDGAGKDQDRGDDDQKTDSKGTCASGEDHAAVRAV